jgi:DNA-directed RNA polymerase subunit RPC12/RpoP
MFTCSKCGVQIILTGIQGSSYPTTPQEQKLLENGKAYLSQSCEPDTQCQKCGAKIVEL